MIDVFETWFNQFSKEEQVKLLVHIKMRHLNMDGNTNDSFLKKQEKKLPVRMNNPKRRVKQIV